MSRFHQITTKTVDPVKKHIVIMGRKTWESMPSTLPGRYNIVLSRSDEKYGDVTCRGLNIALGEYDPKKIENIFVIGGQKVFERAIMHDDCHNLYLTEIDYECECDTSFPEIPHWFVRTNSQIVEDKVPLRFDDYLNTTKSR